ncbi:MAG: proline dehydrogenase, partial [Pyrinomonas methylaliphatogenes]|nr:proline dehydrogenase [Pyrinomonas methylaliphatogenes]
MVTRNALLFLAQREEVKGIITRFRPFRKLTERFVAGEEMEEAIAVVNELNSSGCLASLDHLNEAVTSVAEAEAEVREYWRLLARIDEARVRSNVSIKLTQLGLNIDHELAYRNARAVVAEAAQRGNFVRIDMESSNV